MLHYVHQLLSDCVCLLFAAEQVVYGGFLQLFHWKWRYESAESEPEQLSCGQTDEQWAETHYKAP